MINGITINDIYDDNLERKLKALSGPRRTARIVIDTIENIDDAIPVVTMAHHYTDIMIQIQDSYGEKNMSDSALFAKAEKLFDTFKNQCSLWEVGNEINGDWCSHNIVDRVKKILTLMPPGHKAVQTLFWQPNWESWFAKNLINTEYVFLSYYPHSVDDLQYSATYICGVINHVNPKAQIGIGEWGFEEWQSKQPSWRTKQKIRKSFESPNVTNPNWVGGYFFWDGQQEGF